MERVVVEWVGLFVLMTGSYYVAQADLELVTVLLFQPPNYWYSKLASPHLVQRAR